MHVINYVGYVKIECLFSLWRQVISQIGGHIYELYVEKLKCSYQENVKRGRDWKWCFS